MTQITQTFRGGRRSRRLWVPSIFLLMLSAAAVHDEIGESVAALLRQFYFVTECLPVIVAGTVFGARLFEPKVPAQVPR